MTDGFIDIHHHLVYGLDDGAQTMEDAGAMMRAAAEAGTSVVIGTTHISPGIRPFDLEKYERHLEEMRACCEREGIGLRLLGGCEMLYTAAASHYLSDGRIPTLGGTAYVLVEFLPSIRFESLYNALSDILRNGYLPVVAHVERYDCLLKSPKKAAKVHDELDVLFQMNCATVLGGKGFLSDLRAKRLLDDGLIDIVASDAHNVSSRPTRMREAYAQLAQRYGAKTAAKLTGRSESGRFWSAIRDAL